MAGRKDIAKTDAKEWPVSDEDMEELCDAALNEPSMEAVENFVKGGSDPDFGFAETLRQSRARTAKLAAEVPNVSNILSKRRQRAFLMALSQTGNVGAACAAAGWSRGIPYSLRKADKGFAEKWEFALHNATDILHATAFQRAVHGVQEEVWHKTKDSATVVGHVTRYSDSLLITLLKAHDPDRFRERSEVKHDTSKGGGVLLVPAAVSLDKWEAAAAAQQAKYRERQEVE